MFVVMCYCKWKKCREALPLSFLFFRYTLVCLFPGPDNCTLSQWMLCIEENDLTKEENMMEMNGFLLEAVHSIISESGART